MSNLRESYAGTEFSGLGWRLGEGAVDRVAAMGCASSVGSRLWNAAYGLSCGALARLRQDSVARGRSRFPRLATSVLERLAGQALHEYLSPQCVVCRGAKEVLVGARLLMCSGCGGSGSHRYSDEERARGMNLSYSQAMFHGKHLGWMLGKLAQIDRETNRVMNEQLERDVS